MSDTAPTRRDPECSLLARGELSLTASSDELSSTQAASLRWRDETGGAFTPHRPDGMIDVSGTVKALAMQAAEDDLLCAGYQPDGCVWLVGVVDPADRSSLLFALCLDGTRHAVATSGSAERGDHIWSATAIDRTYLQVTVVADDIETADVLATAIVAGGPTTRATIVEGWPVDVRTVARDGAMTAAAGFSTALVTG